MIVGVISDIHGNLPALQAVLDDMPSVDAVVCAGDIVGYGPWPAACVKQVRSVADIVVQGNHDRAVQPGTDHDLNEVAEKAIDYTREVLTGDQQSWLLNLPPVTEFADGNFRLAHSHPTEQFRGKYVMPSEFVWQTRYLDDQDGLILGHTHIQHYSHVDGHLIVNPGSVGQPRDGESTAAYCLIDTINLEVSQRRVAYSIDEVIARVDEVGLPEEIGTRLRDGH